MPIPRALRPSVSHLAAFALVALASLVTACGGDRATRPAELTVSGAYSLTTENGKPLPWIVFEAPNFKAEITGRVLTVDNAKKTVSSVLSHRDTENGRVTTGTQSEEVGSYVLTADGKITITSTVDVTDTLTGTVSGNTITLRITEDGETDVLVFQK